MFVCVWWGGWGAVEHLSFLHTRVSRYLSTTIYSINGGIWSSGPGTDIDSLFLQVSCYSVHWEPLHYSAAEEDCSVSERNLRGQVRCGRRPEWRLQNTAQSKQAEGQDTNQSKNIPVDLADVAMDRSMLAEQAEHLLFQKISLGLCGWEWLQLMNNHKMMRGGETWKEGFNEVTLSLVRKRRRWNN